MNAQNYIKENKALAELLRKQPFQNVITSDKVIPQTLLSKQQVRDFSRTLKVPEKIILRLNEIIVYSALDTGPMKDQVEKAFRIEVKKRYYLTCVRDYLHLFKDFNDGILAMHFSGGLKEPYIYNSNLIEEGNPFVRNPAEGEEETKEGAAKPGEMTQDQILTLEGLKIQLKNIYNEIINEYQGLKPRIAKIIN